MKASPGLGVVILAALAGAIGYQTVKAQKKREAIRDKLDLGLDDIPVDVPPPTDAPPEAQGEASTAAWLWAYTWSWSAGSWRRTADVGPLQGTGQDLLDWYPRTGGVWFRVWQWVAATWGPSPGSWVVVYDGPITPGSRAEADLAKVGTEKRA